MTLDAYRSVPAFIENLEHLVEATQGRLATVALADGGRVQLTESGQEWYAATVADLAVGRKGILVPLRGNHAIFIALGQAQTILPYLAVAESVNSNGTLNANPIDSTLPTLLGIVSTGVGIANGDLGFVQGVDGGGSVFVRLGPDSLASHILAQALSESIQDAVISGKQDKAWTFSSTVQGIVNNATGSSVILDDLSFPIGAYERWTVDYHLWTGLSGGSNGIRYSVDGPSYASVATMYTGTGRSRGAFASEVMNGNGATTGGPFNAAVLDGGILNASAYVNSAQYGGYIRIRFYPWVAGQNAKVHSWSHVTARRLL